MMGLAGSNGVLGDREQQRKRLAAALERAAALNPFSTIADPVAWQQEQRQDRPLPGRELPLHNSLSRSG